MKNNRLKSWIKTGKDQTWKLALMAMAFSGIQLNAQVTYTFTSGGLTTGSVGPTQAQINTAYAATNLNGSVTVTGQGIQNFTVPVTGAYRIIAVGARGAYNGGYGAYIAGNFNLTAGTVLKIVVGQQGTQGTNGTYISGGGGGGSYVTSSANVPYVVAGGGGGNGDGYLGQPNGVGMQASLLTSGNGNPASMNTGGSNGSGGICGSSSSYAGGGAGITGDGAQCSSSGTAKAFVNGSVGGTGTAGSSGDGGFGGGGGCYNSGTGQRGGGGGGYSGGGGGEATSGSEPNAPGGGGGSYNSGTSQTNSVSVVSGAGQVLITRLCDVNLIASSNPMCIGSVITLSTNAGSNIQWSTGPTTSSINVSPTSTTQYTVTGTSSSTSACTSTLVITVTVNPLPVLSTVVTPSVLCVGKTATATASGAISYNWSNSTAGVTTTFNPSSTTVYTVTGTDIYNCVNTLSVAVVVNTNVLGVSSNTTICAGKSIMITASGASSYTWDSGTQFASIPVSPASTTTYSVMGTDSHNCSISNSVVVTVNPKPNVTVTADKSMICVGETVVLTASGANTYAWSDNSTGNKITPSLPVDVMYSYTVTGTDNNSCTNTAVVTVTVSKCLGISESSLNGSVSVYPNPSNGVFILSSNVTAGTVSVMDVAGRTVLSSEITGAKTELNMSAYASGIYYVKVQSASATEVIRIIKH